MGKINCSRLQVAEGLYNSLRNSVSTTAYGEFGGGSELPEDAALTDLEIDILASYTKQQVDHSSQFILVNLWTWCKGNYTTTRISGGNGENLGHKGRLKYQKNLVHIDCLKVSYTTNVLDYRAQMSQSGYDIIMAYALQSDFYSDTEYLKRTNLRKLRLKVVPSALIYSICANIVSLILTLVIYGSEKSMQGLENVPRFLFKLATIFAVSAFLAILVATVMAMSLLSSVASEVNNLLGDFNVSYSIKTVWIVLLWIAFILTLIHGLSWMLPTSCANPEATYEDDVFDEVYYVPKYDNSRKSSKPLKGRTLSAIFSNANDSALTMGVGVADEKSKKLKNENTLHSDDEMDDELLKLGERLARQPSVRFLNPKRKKKKKLMSNNEGEMMNFNDTKDLLYFENQESHGRYAIDESDDRFRLLSSNSIKRKVKMKIPVINIEPCDEDKDSQVVPVTSNNINSARSSVLNDDEINVLEMNSNMNQIR
ncbi:uncharacterized protein KQ657_000612 [Scheffersomyces spartinae]|uniref:Uncharacterized protein n=1 Tax=Scheffersomyces spartinae TaxID=45513 RepID=A0A9P8AI68_9ASCO|nr:uncharacterized protein KQ657_000612 [Scheffersomyces spartinae]KAG7193543.1 hypothetical protein KQ657_000612 [Scheffersomyces spartinae]